MRRSRRPVGAVLSGAAAVIAAVPTLFFPADSPTEPKLALLAAGAVVFSIAVFRIRAESTEPRTDEAPEDVTGA